MKQPAFVGNFLAAWDLLLDIPIPTAWKRYETDRPDPQLTLLAIPVIGALSAVVILVLGVAYGGIFTRNGAALLFALSATLFLDARDSGRGLGLLLTLLTLAGRKVPLLPALPQLRPSGLSGISGAVPMAAMVLLEMFKLGAFFLLYRHGAGCWLAGVLILSFTIQGFLMGLPDLDTGHPFLEISGVEQSRIWLSGTFLMLFVALKLPLAAIVGTGCAVVFAWTVRNAAEKIYGGISAEMITLAGAAAEVGLLLIGFLFAA